MLKTKDRSVGKFSLDQPAGRGPFVWESHRLVELNGFEFQRLWNHVVLSLPRENVGVRQVKRLFENDLLVFPNPSILARRQPNFASVGLMIENFEKHVPAIVGSHDKRIGHESSSR